MKQGYTDIKELIEDMKRENANVIELIENDYAREITQESDLGHSDILNIAKLLIFYCKEMLREDIEINGEKKFVNNYNDLCEIFSRLKKNITEHNNIK